MAHTYYSISNHPHLKEGNPLLPKRPSLAQLVLHKGITVPLVGQNVEAGQMTIINTMVTVVVLNNFRLYATTPKGCINYHVDGYMVPC